MGLRSSAAIAARKSRRVPPRIRCCIRNSDRIDGAPSESRAATCTRRTSDRLLPRRATRLRADPRPRRTPATRGSGAAAHVRSARRPTAAPLAIITYEEPGGILAGLRARGCGAGISPSESRSGHRRWIGCYVADCVVRQASSAHLGSDRRRSHRRVVSRVPRSGRPREDGRLRCAVGQGAVVGWGARDCLDTSTGDARTDRWAGRAFARASCRKAANSGRWPKT